MQWLENVNTSKLVSMEWWDLGGSGVRFFFSGSERRECSNRSENWLGAVVNLSQDGGRDLIEMVMMINLKVLQGRSCVETVRSAVTTERLLKR